MLQIDSFHLKPSAITASLICRTGMWNRRNKGINCKKVQFNKNTRLRKEAEKVRIPIRTGNSGIISWTLMEFVSDNLEKFVQVECVSSNCNNFLKNAKNSWTHNLRTEHNKLLTATSKRTMPTYDSYYRSVAAVTVSSVKKRAVVKGGTGGFNCDRRGGNMRSGHLRI